MEPTFLFKFPNYINKNKQSIGVFLWDVHPTTFARWKNGYWGYFQAMWSKRNDWYFGELHFVESRLRFDTISHEMLHAQFEWMWAYGDTLTRRNEENICDMNDAMIRNFLRELRKVRPKMRLT